jgi:hypothetical protein
VSSGVSCWSCRVPLEDELHVELEVLTYVTSGDDVELLVRGDSLIGRFILVPFSLKLPL